MDFGKCGAWEFSSLGILKFGNLGVKNSGVWVFWIRGNVKLWNFRSWEFGNSRVRDLWCLGCVDFVNCGIMDFLSLDFWS